MKNHLIYIFSLLILSCSSQKKPEIALKNSLDIERADEIVTLSRDQIDNLVSEGQKGFFPVLIENEAPTPYQLEDIDADGQWDQLIFVSDFKPLEEKKIGIRFQEKAPIYPKGTDVHFGIGKSKQNVAEVQEYYRENDPRKEIDKDFFQMEGPAWENDKVGFRMYFDPRNGIDIFGKTTKDLVLSKTGITGDYHKKADWGMDILKVGNSLGAGSIAIKSKDSLYRITGVNGTTFRVIEEGPIKATFELQYKNDSIQETSIDVRHKISIYKGQWYYKSEVSLSGIQKDMKLVSGIVNLKPNTVKTIESNEIFGLHSFGKQSEDGDHLGMALIIPKDSYEGHDTVATYSKDITDSYYVTIKPNNKAAVPFYFISGWEASDTAFSSEAGFTATVKHLMARISNPITVLK